MAKKFSLKLYTGFKLINYPEDTSYNEHTDEVEFTAESDEYCLTFKEFTFNEEIDKPIYELRESFENVHQLFSEKNYADDKKKRVEFIISKNNEQFKIAAEKLAKWKSKSAAYPNSQTVLRKIQYLETVLSEFDHWFDNTNIKPTSISNKRNQTSFPLKASTESISLAAFMRLLLKKQVAKKFLQSTESYKKKMGYVSDAIKEKGLIVKKVKSGTLLRYVKPKKILEFLTKKNNPPKIPLAPLPLSLLSLL